MTHKSKVKVNYLVVENSISGIDRRAMLSHSRRQYFQATCNNIIKTVGNAKPHNVARLHVKDR
jgi:hypothetical protein